MAERNRTLAARWMTVVANAVVIAFVLGATFGTGRTVFAQSETELNPPAAERDAPGEGEAGADAMVEELTRGVVHEAYAQPVVFNPEAGDVVAEAPPEAIEELPPEEKPEGDYVQWIPGYWSWDDDENHYVWVSGIWRVIPPGLEWTPGYWTKTDRGYQWVSGFWRQEETEEVEYLPQPPASVERGPAVDPPSDDHVWVPGTWIWTTSRYAWRPGYWVPCRPGWVWVPARYVWTPYGFVYCDGYWDYSLPRRGVLYAPIWFPRGYTTVRAYRYSPRVVIDVNVFSSHLFCRPTRSAYCFGDYYAESHFRRGIYPSYAYHMSRYGYDPVYAYRKWEHVRQEPNWHEQVRADYRHRRDHVDARPPHTVLASQQLLAIRPAPDVQNLLLATSLSQVAARPNAPFKVEKVSVERRDEYRRDIVRWNDVQTQRRDTEMKHAQELAQRRIEETRNGTRDVLEGGRGDTKPGEGGRPDPRHDVRHGMSAQKLKLPTALAAAQLPGDNPLVGGNGPGKPEGIPGAKPEGKPEGKPGEGDRPRRERPGRPTSPDFVSPPRPETPRVELPKVAVPEGTIPKLDRTRDAVGRGTRERDPLNRPAVEKPDRPVTDRPAAEKPAIARPATEKPATERPTFEKPTFARPSVEKPAMDRPARERPSTDRPATERSNPDRPTFERPKVERPKVERPAAEKPAVERPKVERPKVETPKVDRPPTARRSEAPGGDRGNSALDDARRNNQRAIEDAQRRVKEQQDAIRKRAEGVKPPTASREREKDRKEKDK